MTKPRRHTGTRNAAESPDSVQKKARSGTIDGFDYPRYLASREWALKKQALRKRSGGFCERCSAAKYEQTHHVTYESIGNEPLEDLLAVCAPCHEFLSGKTDKDPCEELGFLVVVVNRKNGQAFIDTVIQDFNLIGVTRAEHVEFVPPGRHGKPRPAWRK